METLSTCYPLQYIVAIFDEQLILSSEEKSCDETVLKVNVDRLTINVDSNCKEISTLVAFLEFDF